MTKNELKKIIVEELRKVLKEQDEVGPTLGGAQPFSSGEGNTRFKKAGSIEPQQKVNIDLSIFSSRRNFMNQPGTGVPCKNARVIQTALKNKLQLLAKSVAVVQDMENVVGRLSDGVMGPTTVGILNGFLAGSSLPDPGTPESPIFAENMAGFKQACAANANTIVNYINSSDLQKVSQYFASKTKLAVRSSVQKTTLAGAYGKGGKETKLFSNQEGGANTKAFVGGRDVDAPCSSNNECSSGKCLDNKCSSTNPVGSSVIKPTPGR